jgi:uncharacterized MAPEG superfamily protein
LVPFELRVLGFTVLLGFVHIVLASHSASIQRGYRWTASARDEPVAPLSGAAGRLARALANFCETFPFFAALALAVVLASRAGSVSQWGAGLYLAGRVLYLPSALCLWRAACPLAGVERLRGWNPVVGICAALGLRRSLHQASNPSIERTCSSRLRLPPHAARVER